MLGWAIAIVIVLVKLFVPSVALTSTVTLCASCDVLFAVSVTEEPLVAERLAYEPLVMAQV